ncbi:ribosomal protein S5 [Naganishia adeliensis]|uniref:Ribosomal protein S5 n=1 Tax=Naganishia adeliensis TaxID=92952 RepID=A0ACC2WQZ4_9TREE|nr:ribosomal protein S5 [Naganishia adeliensis]
MAAVQTLPSDIAKVAAEGNVKLFGKWTAHERKTMKDRKGKQEGKEGSHEGETRKTNAQPKRSESRSDESMTDLSSSDSVEVKDISLVDYVNVQHAVYLPHTAGRYAKKQFAKGRMPIVERLVNALMMNGRNNGKKLMAVRIVAHAFEIIHLLTDQNPIQVLVDAIVNTGPREDSTRIGSQGTVRRQAVDVSPLRRVNQAISLLTIGTRESAFHNVKSISECLADELVNAAKGSSNSYAIKKKDELERVSKSNR